MTLLEICVHHYMQMGTALIHFPIAVKICATVALWNGGINKEQ